MPDDRGPPRFIGGMSRRSVLAAIAALAGSACTQLEFLAANTPALFGSFRRRANIAYGPDEHQRLDIYEPQIPHAGPRAVIVFWHGGRWSEGDKSQYRFVGAALAGLGYVAILPNYRHYPQVKMPGFMQDSARAAAWAVNYARESHDEKRFFLTGHSAGAHLAALLALDPRYFSEIGVPTPPIAGMIGLSGPYDFLPLREADLQDMFGPADLYPLSQPINFVRADAPPMLLIAGERDVTVLPKNTRNFAAALQAKGVKVTLRLYPGLKHADTVAALSELARGRAPILADIRAFVDQVS
jgi:acetyl esterase/lipase